MRLLPGFRPGRAGETYSCALPQIPYLDLRGLLLWGGEGMGREERRRKGKERGGRGKGEGNW